MEKKHILYNNDLAISNSVDNNISNWVIVKKNNKVMININRINSIDVIALISINSSNNNSAVVQIKQTPINLYVSYNDESIGYDVNNYNTDIIISIIEDYLNGNGFSDDNHIKNVLKYISHDIESILNYIYNNKDLYIKYMNKELNNIRANYVIESAKVKKKMRVINNYRK